MSLSISPGGIARTWRGARGSAAVRARRSRLAEHGAQRRADGLDGENRVPSWNHSGNTARSTRHFEELTGVEGSYREWSSL